MERKEQRHDFLGGRPPLRCAARPAGQAREQSVLPTALLPKHPLGDVVAPEIGGAEVAEGDLGGFVAGLAHQLGEAGAGVAGGGGEAGAQAVAGVALRVEPGVARGLLDQAGDRLVGERLRR